MKFYGADIMAELVKLAASGLEVLREMNPMLISYNCSS